LFINKDFFINILRINFDKLCYLFMKTIVKTYRKLVATIIKLIVKVNEVIYLKDVYIFI